MWYSWNPEQKSLSQKTKWNISVGVFVLPPLFQKSQTTLSQNKALNLGSDLDLQTYFIFSSTKCLTLGEIIVIFAKQDHQAPKRI